MGFQWQLESKQYQHLHLLSSQMGNSQSSTALVLPCERHVHKFCKPASSKLRRDSFCVHSVDSTCMACGRYWLILPSGNAMFRPAQTGFSGRLAQLFPRLPGRLLLGLGGRLSPSLTTPLGSAFATRGRSSRSPACASVPFSEGLAGLSGHRPVLHASRPTHLRPPCRQDNRGLQP